MIYSNETSVDYLDRVRLDKFYGDDKNQLTLVLTIFLNDVVRDLYVVEQFLNQEKWTEAADTAHKERPWLGMAGLTSLETKLFQFEKQAKFNPEPTTLLEMWASIKMGVEQMIPVLEEELKQLA